MNRNQKLVLRTLGILVGTKIIVYAAIYYSDRYYKKSLEKINQA